MAGPSHLLHPATLTALFACLCTSPLFSQQAVPLENGPVHEAFASPSTDVVLLQAVAEQPPAEINEVQPRQCGDSTQWIRGYWSWSEPKNTFVWISGVWRAPPEGRSWVSGKWGQVDSGWVWQQGFWSDQPEEKIAPIAKRPPDSIEEAPPARPGEDSFWVQGFWNYDRATGEYKWLSGQWSTFDPHWVYTPAQYLWRSEGYLFVPAYWDLPLDKRGCAYASVEIAPEYREVIYYEPFIVVDSQKLLQRYSLSYPNYMQLFSHHWHFHPQSSGTPPWWGWSSCWCFNSTDSWALWWWWTHPGYPSPAWMNESMSSQLPPPGQELLDRMKEAAPPYNVLPWGIVKPADLVNAIEDETGRDDPLLPGNVQARDRIFDAVKPPKGAPQKPLLPTGTAANALPRPHFETPPLPKERQGGALKLPGKPVPSATPMPSVVPPKAAPPIAPPPPPAMKAAPPKPAAQSHPRRRNPPSTMPPSYQPQRYKTSQKQVKPAPAEEEAPIVIYKPSLDKGPKINWPWREPQGGGESAPSGRPQRIHQLRSNGEQSDGEY